MRAKGPDAACWRFLYRAHFSLTPRPPLELTARSD
jgi:hypothetical protein